MTESAKIEKLRAGFFHLSLEGKKVIIGISRALKFAETQTQKKTPPQMMAQRDTGESYGPQPGLRGDGSPLD
jgi:hypothetical protein